MSKRSNFYQYYRKPKDQRDRFLNSSGPYTRLLSILEKSAASTVQQERFAYKGEAIVDAVVVRCDLNGYSLWARDKSLRDRAFLLDDFFSFVFGELEAHGGVYFRDEGDCLVALFSSYFDPNFSYRKIEPFCTRIVGRTYGRDNLTSKAVVSCGQVAIFQKNHEIGGDDWSAEGEPFVLTARVEQAVDSKQRIYYFHEDYNRYFSVGTSWAPPGGTYYWLIDIVSIQIKGIGKVAGWEDFSVHEYIPGGKMKS